MNREILRDQLGLDDSATDAEILAAARAAKSRAKRLAESAANAAAAKLHRDSIVELDGMLTACGLGSEPPKERTPAPRQASANLYLGEQFAAGRTEGPHTPGPSLALEPGRVLGGRYRILRRLGAGGMGVVFAAADQLLKREVAVKVILPELAGIEEIRERFLQEVKVATSLAHPGIVKVIDVHSDGEFLFLTMELLEGETLAEQMERRWNGGQTYGIDEVVRIAQSVGEVLVYAHQHTVHRDIKPENVFCCADGRLVLLDFGLAKLRSASALTRTGETMGSAYYVAPEQLGGAAEVDARADQFSVGVVLYELLTGKLPTGIAAPIEKLRPEVPRGLADVVQRAMSSDPGERFASMQELLVAMRGDEDVEEEEEEESTSWLPFLGLVGAVLVLFAGWWIATLASAKQGEVVPNADFAKLGPPKAVGGTSFVNGIGQTMIFLAPGTFVMGSPESEGGRWRSEKRHQVTFSGTIGLAATEVTQKQWFDVMRTRPWKGRVFVQEGEEVAASYIHWIEAVDFCRKLTEREQQAGKLPTGYEYRLPTEAEWERAARAGSSAQFSFGDQASELGKFAVFSESKRGAHAHVVRSKQPNEWGFFDMHGNVSEWCADFIEGVFSLAIEPDTEIVTDPVCGSGLWRVCRGGSWFVDSAHCRSASRGCCEPDGASFGLGFRPALAARSQAK